MTWVPAIFALPSILLGHIFVLFCWAIRLVQGLHYRGPVLCAYHRKSRRFSTTIGHGMILSPRATSRTISHELVHTDQYEDLCLLGAILGGLLCIVDWRLGLLVYATSGAPWLLPNFITGFFRYFKATKGRDKRVFDAGYYGAAHERHAYAEVQGYPVDERFGK